MRLQILELLKFKHRWSWCLRTNMLQKCLSPYRGPYNGKNFMSKTNPKNWTYITNNAFSHSLAAIHFSRVIGKKRSFSQKFQQLATWRANVCTLILYPFGRTFNPQLGQQSLAALFSQQPVARIKSFAIIFKICTLHPRYNALQYNMDLVIMQLRSWTQFFR